MKIIKSQTGFAHSIILGLFVIAAISAVGLHLTRNSGAAGLKTRGTITVKAYKFDRNCNGICIEDYGKAGSKTSLRIAAISGKNTSCNSKLIDSNWTNVGTVRRLNCSPGTYTLALSNPTKLKFKCQVATCITDNSVTVNLEARSKHSLNLGTSDKF